MLSRVEPVPAAFRLAARQALPTCRVKRLRLQAAGMTQVAGIFVRFDPPEQRGGAAHLEEIHGEHRERERDEQHHREKMQYREATDAM